MPPTPPDQVTSPGPRRAFLRRHPAVVLGLVVAAAFTVLQTMNQVEESSDREPFRAAARAAAAAGTSIAVVDPATANAWGEGSGPAESAVPTSGSSLLEPIFRSRVKDAGDTADGRCHYVAVQPGPEFDPDTVVGVIRICYVDPGKTPSSFRQTSALRR